MIISLLPTLFGFFELLIVKRYGSLSINIDIVGHVLEAPLLFENGRISKSNLVPNIHGVAVPILHTMTMP